MWKRSVLASFIALAGCSVSNDVPTAEKAISSFHSELNAGDFRKIYNNTDTDFKAATKEADFLKLLGLVHSKLGYFKTGKSLRWSDDVMTNGHRVALSYKASYQNGDADETFVYRLNNGNTALIGYRVNSNVFFLNQS